MPGAPYPRDARIRRRADFARVFAAGAALHGQFLRVHLAPAPGTAARLGFALSRRHVPKAHDRNRVKRIVREAFRRRRERLPPLDVVVALRAAPPAANPPLHAEAALLMELLLEACPERLPESLRAARRRLAAHPSTTPPDEPAA